MVTKIFRSGNSLAIRIPAKISFGKAGDEVEINLRNERILITPHRRSLKGLMNRFAAFDSGFMKEGREHGPEPERNW